MTVVNRVRAAWTNFTGAPGVNTFYTTDPTTFLPALHSFYGSLTGAIPGDLKIDIEPSGDIFDATSGALTGAWAGTAPGTVTGTGTGTNSGATGAVIGWHTTSIVGRRKLQGRTFIVPMVQGSFTQFGQLTGGEHDGLKAAGDALITAAGTVFVVWHKPKGSSAGAFAAVSSCTVPITPAVLKSRRT